MKKFLSILCLMFATSAYAQDTKLIHEKDIAGKWNVAGFMTNEGRFSHCSALTVYEAHDAQARKRLRGDSMGMIVKLLADNTYEFILVSKHWKLPDNKEYLISFKWESGGEASGTATAYDGTQLIISGSGDQEGDWYVNLAKSKWVELKVDDHSLGRLPLDKSRLALEELMSCYVGIQEAQKSFDEKTNDTFGERLYEGNPEDTFGAQ